MPIAFSPLRSPVMHTSYSHRLVPSMARMACAGTSQRQGKAYGAAAAAYPTPPPCADFKSSSICLSGSVCSNLAGLLWSPMWCSKKDLLRRAQKWTPKLGPIRALLTPNVSDTFAVPTSRGQTRTKKRNTHSARHYALTFGCVDFWVNSGREKRGQKCRPESGHHLNRNPLQCRGVESDLRACRKMPPFRSTL